MLCFITNAKQDIGNYYWGHHHTFHQIQQLSSTNIVMKTHAVNYVFDLLHCKISVAQIYKEMCHKVRWLMVE